MPSRCLFFSGLVLPSQRNLWEITDFSSDAALVQGIPWNMINNVHILRQHLKSKGKPTLPPLARKMHSLVVLEMKMCKFIRFQVRINWNRSCAVWSMVRLVLCESPLKALLPLCSNSQIYLFSMPKIASDRTFCLQQQQLTSMWFVPFCVPTQLTFRCWPLD